MNVTAWRSSTGMHLYRDCPDSGSLPRRTVADPRTVRCGSCVLRTITESHGVGAWKGCGTHAGYNAHRSRGEDPCATCKKGEREYNTAARRRSRQRAAETAKWEAHRDAMNATVIHSVCTENGDNCAA